MNKLSSGNVNTIPNLIIQGLGYCCVWKFFSLYRRTNVIALRLGVTTRAVRKWKSKCKNGECSCEHSPRCMKDKLT